jgi:hypothetical protein
MITREVWEDKFPEDKVKYYNKTRMSLDLFAKTIGIAPQVLRRNLEQHGYRYIEANRKFEESSIKKAFKRLRCS